MNARGFWTATLILTTLAPGAASASESKGKKAGDEGARLERKCEREDDKDEHDERRGRRHAPRENRWDESCAVAPPALPPPTLPPPAPLPPPVLQPPVLTPPVLPPPILPPA